MTVAQVQDVRVRQVSVLVYFVWVVGSDASLGGKGELGHHIVNSVWIQGNARVGVGGRLRGRVRLVLLW